ncbi:hypothetical protein E4O93_04760 [Diaphorobacter sp. DS2]|nr:hypothetical protein E4O93_04760 [Diaphorobacter sp. DS2]
MWVLLAWMVSLWRGRQPLPRARKSPPTPAGQAPTATFLVARLRADRLAPIHAPPPRLLS